MAYELTAEQKEIAISTFCSANKVSIRTGLYVACAAVLESATEPGAALSDAEWTAMGYLVTRAAIGPEPAIFIRSQIDAILAQRRVLKGAPASQSTPAPAQAKGDGETAHRMAQAYMNIPIGRRDERWIAVLQVAREGYWSAEAIEEAIANAWIAMCQHSLPDLIRSVRQRLSAPTAKTLEERFKLTNCDDEVLRHKWAVTFDSRIQATFAEFSDAERYMAHRVSELAQLRKEQP